MDIKPSVIGCGQPIPARGSNLRRQSQMPSNNQIVISNVFQPFGVDYEWERNLDLAADVCVYTEDDSDSELYEGVNEEPAIPMILNSAGNEESPDIETFYPCGCETRLNLCSEMELNCQRAFGLMKILEIAEYAAKRATIIENENRDNGVSNLTGCSLERHLRANLWLGNVCPNNRCLKRFQAIIQLAERLAIRAKKSAERRITTIRL
ncbi:uncharacterized protein LOC129959546 isoform X2 [Argiope bruennichi]|uniref:Uncharacterized protein n=1 Tax=Argiope bruennichi TaxID=94029 RepID=A0A8T0F144_ARGBR|nr:uncharacterized protein LOC129959546 isoform X2 [Argiope bruennichi]KAF8784807.1 hypothetical protein HNY73_010436 [Argiope bruennichi]